MQYNWPIDRMNKRFPGGILIQKMRGTTASAIGPRPAKPWAKNSMKGVSVPAPAPCRSAQPLCTPVSVFLPQPRRALAPVFASEQSVQGAFFSPSQCTTHEPSLGKPGADLSGPASQPAAISATAYSRPPLLGI